MRQPQAGCNAPSAIITAAAQFIDIADVTPQACSTKPIDYSYSLGYHVSPSLHLQALSFTRPRKQRACEHSACEANGIPKVCKLYPAAQSLS